jgi:hypothetical protein
MAWTVPAPGIVELIRHFFPNPDAAGASATARGAAAAADDVVTIEDLKSSSRVRFWVPPQLMKEFLD